MYYNIINKRKYRSGSKERCKNGDIGISRKAQRQQIHQKEKIKIKKEGHAVSVERWKIMDKLVNTLKMEIYNKGGSTWYCDYYFYNGIASEQGTTKAGGYGYDKHSAATSNAINKFKFLYKIKNGTKWDGLEHSNLKNGSRIYGLYKDKTISYGMGLSSVLNCLKAFSNVKIKYINYGKNSDFIHLEITTTEKQLQKEIGKQQKIINNKKTSKEDKKEAKNIINKIKELFNI